MRKAFLGLLISLVFGSFVLVSAKPRPKRIHFKPGQTEICLHGYLRSRTDTARYVLRAKKGQTIEVKVFCGDKIGDISIHTDVFDSAGKPGGDNDMQGNSGFANTKAGDYVVTVAASGKDNSRRGRFFINVSVQ
jgi:hypothetical protein